MYVSSICETTGEYVGDSELQLQRIYVYFNESSQKRYVPRYVNTTLLACVVCCTYTLSIGRPMDPLWLCLSD